MLDEKPTRNKTAVWAVGVGPVPHWHRVVYDSHGVVGMLSDLA